MKKNLIVVAAMLCTIFLSACGGGAQGVDNALAFLTALNQGDVDGARQYVCEEEADDMIEGLSTVSDGERQTWDFQNLSCSAYSGDVKCSYQIMQTTDDNRTQTDDHSVTFDMKGGKVCGFAEQVEE
jgi:hypothetical protein